MTSPLLGEFLGTMVLILLGNGVVAGALLKGTKAEGSGWIVITAGWAFAVMAGVFTAIACGSSDAHLNPAVTLGFAARAGNFSNVAPYFAAQLLGGLVGGILVWVHYLPHWKETPDGIRKRNCFCTSPAIRAFVPNLVSETIATFVLVFVVGAIFSKSVAAGGAVAGLGPYLVGSLVWGIGLSLGGTTGYAINPARDLGPRIAHALLPLPEKASSDWSYGTIAIVGPLIGGALAGVALRMLGVK
jgi:glycerol uptake facilitator protein